MLDIAFFQKFIVALPSVELCYLSNNSLLL